MYQNEKSQSNQTWWEWPAKSVVHIFGQKFHGSHLGFLYQSENSYFLPLNYTNPSQTKLGGNDQLVLTNIATDIRSDILTDILTDISTDITIDITNDILTDITTDIAADIVTDILTNLQLILQLLFQLIF